MNSNGLTQFSYMSHCDHTPGSGQCNPSIVIRMKTTVVECILFDDVYIPRDDECHPNNTC